MLCLKQAFYLMMKEKVPNPFFIILPLWHLALKQLRWRWERRSKSVGAIPLWKNIWQELWEVLLATLIWSEMGRGEQKS